MTIRDFYLIDSPGSTGALNSRAFPLSKSLADWATYKVAPTESAAPNAGRFVWKLNDDYGTDWIMFPSDTAPTDWSSGNVIFFPQANDYLKEKYSVKDTFAGAPSTPLAGWTPLINTTKSKWVKRVGVNMTLVTDVDIPAVKMDADDFTQLGTLYTIDAGCTSYILRARVRVNGANYGRLYFRCDSTNKGYSILWTQQGGSSWFRLSKYDGATTTTVIDLSGSSAPSLVSNQYYWIQVHVTGTRVRAFVEGFPYLAITAEMDEFFDSTFVGIGGPRASTYWSAVEVRPLDMSVEFDAVSARMTLLEAAVDSLVTAVPSALEPMSVDLTALITARTLAAADYVTNADLAERTLLAAEYATAANLTSRTLPAADYVTESEFNARTLIAAAYVTGADLSARTLPAAYYATAADLAAVQSDTDAMQSSLAQWGTAAQWLPPVAPTGSITEPIIIGDDYLAANLRAFQWTIAAVASVAPATAVFYFGGQSITTEGEGWLVQGTVTDLGGGLWLLSADLPKSATQSLSPGAYRWSGEVRSSSGVEVTRIRGCRAVQLVRKQT